MNQQHTSPLRPFALIAIVFFFGSSLLFSGCAPGGGFVCDECHFRPDKAGPYVIQYLSCNGDIKSTRRDWTGVNPSDIQATDIEDCERLIKVSPVPTSN